MTLPIYKIKIDMNDTATGLTAVSLVDFPAVEKDFLLFDKQELMFKADEEKQIISGIAILADTPIYRRNQNGEFYVVFEKDTIRQLVEKYSKNGMFNSVNLQHQSNSFVNNVYLIESLIIDKERGICPTEFSDCPDGSWYVSYFVEDKTLWDEIKNGEWFNGFSVEITANLELNKINKKETNMNNYFKLAKKILKLAEVKTDKETLIIDGELEVGKPVFIESEEGPIDAPNGTYTTEDGTVITVEEGVITEIQTVEEETPTEEVIEAEETPTEEETPNPEVEELKAKIAELEAIIAEKDAEIEQLNEKLAENEEKLKMSVETPLTKKVSVSNRENKALKYFG